jgi:NTP pyrophosphatase (non-canonical NTP hydrolase)
MELEELMKKIAEKYLEIDKKSGELFLFSVLVEEVGELAEAIRKKEISSIEEELTDVAFVVLCISNLFGINIEKKIFEKYIVNDPSKRWDLPEHPIK